MRIINTDEIINNIKEMCIEANHYLAPDMLNVLNNARKNEKSPLGSQILEQLDENLKIAAEDMIPICPVSYTHLQFSLKEVIRQTSFAINDAAKNKLLTGELFEVHGNKLKVVALDKFRIAIRNIELKEEYGDFKVLVPGKSLNEISKILNGGVDDDVNIYFTNNHILFEFDDTIVVSRLIEATNYFDTDKMISNDYKTKITINKKEMADCIDRATPVSYTHLDVYKRQAFVSIH